MVSEIIWKGDLDDDCTARWNGLILRAERMEGNTWWWAVSKDNQNPLNQIDSSNNYDSPCLGGKQARQMAEAAALKYIEEYIPIKKEMGKREKPGCVIYISALVLGILLLIKYFG